MSTPDEVLERAFYNDPYSTVGPVEHEYREPGAADRDPTTVTGLVRVANGSRFVGLVQQRTAQAEAAAVNRFGPDIFVPERDDGAALEPNDRFAMQRGPEAYRATLRVADRFQIAFRLYVPRRQLGVDRRRLPLIVRLHGVPTNKEQMHAVDRRLAQFVPVLTFDMLGMGQSDKPRFIGPNTPKHRAELERYLRDGSATGKRHEDEVWRWINDVEYIDELVRAVSALDTRLGRNEDRKFIFMADDWGGGQAVSFAAALDRERLLGLVLVDPIAFDGYPVNEIEAIGRASLITDDAQFMSAFGAADQNMIQIYKTMVHDMSRYNQYTYRQVLHQYAVANYAQGVRQPDGTRVPFNPRTAMLDFHALRVLAERSSILSPALLLPRTQANPLGVPYDNITVPVKVMWGYKDNMMPAHQRFRFKYALVNAPVQITPIADAGHFAGFDRPAVVAEETLNWLEEYHGRDIFQQPFLGFRRDEIRKGDDSEFKTAIGTAIRNGDLPYAAPEKVRAKLKKLQTLVDKL